MKDIGTFLHGIFLDRIMYQASTDGQIVPYHAHVGRPQSRHLLVNLEKLGFHEKPDFWPHMAIEGVLTRQKCADKWCATLWAPGLQFSVSPNRPILNFHDIR